jgi:hypothetical protein
MSHKHTTSVESVGSSLTSLSSASSRASLTSVISVREDTFKEAVNDLKAGDIPLSELIETAVVLINTIASNEEKNTFEYSKSKLNLHTVLQAMLDHAEGCGGQDGKRYTASAIYLCSVEDDPDNEKTLLMLRDLAITWVSHLLFICRCQLNH